MNNSDENLQANATFIQAYACKYQCFQVSCLFAVHNHKFRDRCTYGSTDERTYYLSAYTSDTNGVKNCMQFFSDFKLSEAAFS